MMSSSFVIFCFNDPATTAIYTLSLHDALPRSHPAGCRTAPSRSVAPPLAARHTARPATQHSGARRPESAPGRRSEEHTSELQSRLHLVCRLLLEKKQTFLNHRKDVHRVLLFDD